MKVGTVHAGPKVVVEDAPFPELPSPNHLIIRVLVAGSNPKDWAIAERTPGTTQGDDIAGIVHSVGSNVTNFKPGDRVAAFHEMLTPNGAFGEYGVAPESTTFHLPAEVSFEEGATIPLAAMTAALGMYQRLGLPLPWLPAQGRLPLVVYSASSAVGAFAVKFASLSNIHPIIAIAGRGTAYVETLLDKSKGDVTIDYRQGNDAVVKELKNILAGESLHYAFDAVSDKGSFQNLMKVMDLEKGRIALVLARKRYDGIPEGFQKYFTQVGKVHGDHYPGLKGEKKLKGLLGDQAFGPIFFKFIERGLFGGWFTGHPFEVIPGGLHGIQAGLSNLKSGKASALKYVYRIEETDGLSSANL